MFSLYFYDLDVCLTITHVTSSQIDRALSLFFILVRRANKLRNLWMTAWRSERPFITQLLCNVILNRLPSLHFCFHFDLLPDLLPSSAEVILDACITSIYFLASSERTANV